MPFSLRENGASGLCSVYSFRRNALAVFVVEHSTAF
jgi:hypothetical protein